MIGMTIEEVALSALAATSQAEVDECFLAARAFDVNVRCLHPLTGLNVRLQSILTDAFLDVMPRALCEPCAAGAHGSHVEAFPTGRRVYDTDPYRERTALVAEVVHCRCRVCVEATA